MQNETNENIKMITKMVRDLGKKHVEPFRKQWDDEQTFPIEVFKKFGEF